MRSSTPAVLGTSALPTTPVSPAAQMRGDAPTSHPSLDRSRFVPGTVLDKRFRIVGLLGRGGMGEVYRADDLKLGQPVALKRAVRELQRKRGIQADGI